MRRLACAMVVGLLAVAGCTKSDTVAVTGTVTINGQPAGDAEVMFTPQGAGRLAAARTDSSGHFSLSTPKEGLVPGDYNVTLGEYYPPDKPPALPKGGGLLPSRFPPKYADPAQSPLKAHVERGQANDFKFEATK